MSAILFDGQAARVEFDPAGGERIARAVGKGLPGLRRTWGGEIPIDLVSCYASLPQGFEAETTRVYRVGDYRGREGRRKLYRELAPKRYSLMGIVCSGEPIMTKWKWALAARVPAKVFVINENGDYFWLDRLASEAHPAVCAVCAQDWRGPARSARWRSVVSFPFTLLYLLLYATAVHTRRALTAKVDLMKAIQVTRTRRSRKDAIGGRRPRPAGSQAGAGADAASGVNFIDVYFRIGLYKADLPITLGSEGAGTVEAVGAGGHRSGAGRPRGLCHGARLVRRVRGGAGGAAGQDSRSRGFPRRPRPPCCRA